MSLKSVKIPGVGMRNVKTALAAAFCAFIYYFFDRSPAFACIGAIFGMGSDMEDSRKNGGNRLFGTLIGGLLGMVLFRLYLFIEPTGKYTLWLVPLTFIGTVFVFSLIYYACVGGAGQYGALGMAVYEILAGGVFFGAFFCATDYVTSPIMNIGKIIYAIGCGVFTMIIRLFASYPEGVSFAILFMNVMTPLIDRFVERQYYGIARAEKAAKKAAAKAAGSASADEAKGGAKA